MGRVAAIRTIVDQVEGRRITVRRGQVLPESDPVVAANPHHFRAIDPEDAPVEQATAAPGERRTVTKKARKKATRKKAAKKTPADTSNQAGDGGNE